MAPVEQVLIYFSPYEFPFVVGAMLENVVSNAQCGALFIDLTESNTRTVLFDFNEGWATSPTPGATWAQNVAAGAIIRPLLVQPLPSTPAA